MTDLGTALADAAHQPNSVPDMLAARRRGRYLRHRRTRRVAAVLVAVSVAVSLAVTRLGQHERLPSVRVATSADGWSTFTSRAGDLEIRYPVDWNVARTGLTPHLTDPHEVVALGTYRMEPADHNCAHIPVNALEQLRPTDAFIWITERTGTNKLPAWNFGPRPTSFGPTSGTDANGGDLAACLNHPLAGSARAISFDDHGRHFTITYAVGRHATQQRHDDTLKILNSFKITAPSTTATTQTCTEADVAKPVGDGMPTPHAVTRRFVLEKNTAWLDPPGTMTPTVTADAAWQKLTKGLTGGGRPQLLLGYYTSIFPLKNGVPEEVHVLAWAVYVHHNAIVPIGGGPLLPDTRTTVPQPICGFGDWYTVLNATTGQQLIIASQG